MDLDLPAGNYVVAVSGGVDSVVLLHILAAQHDLKITVAHFDHGIRTDSSEDRKFVERLAAKYKLPFEYHEGNLGIDTNEADARSVRYRFLRDVQNRTQADAIITAHHQDDVLETIILNLLRGTGPRGLHSLHSTDSTLRPLLKRTKATIKEYAIANGLEWHEDSTNSNQKYLRNYIRANITPRFNIENRQALLHHAQYAAKLTADIDIIVDEYLHHQLSPNQLNRYDFTQLPHVVAREILAVWLRKQAGTVLSRQLLERLVVAAKTGLTGSSFDVQAGYRLRVLPCSLALERSER